MDSKNKDIVYRVVERFFEDRFPKEVEEEVQRWLINDSNLSEKTEATQELWEIINIESSPSVYNSLNSVKQKLGLSSVKKKVPLHSYFLRIAAVLLPLLLVIGTYIYLDKPEAAITSQLIEISVPYGERKQIILPDSTSVNINAGSIIRYEDPFTDNKRLVELSGEAYFSVTEDSLKPFIVQTEHMSVEVLGTEFNVEAYSGNTNTTVILDKGKVQVKTPDEKVYTLSPNQKLVVNNTSSEVSIEDVPEEDETSWISGELIFKDMPFKEIIQTLERQFNISIEINDPSILNKDDVYTIKFRKEDNLENVLDIIEIVVGDISFRQIEKNRIILE